MELLIMQFSLLSCPFVFLNILPLPLFFSQGKREAPCEIKIIGSVLTFLVSDGVKTAFETE
jgi:peptidoglycan biosynthesis protein MviN/MurJ (putative lipid II flippase)